MGPACTFWPDKIAQLIVWNVNTVDEKRRCFPISPPVVRFGSLHTVGSASFFPDGPLRRESSPPNAENQTCKTTIGRQLASHILRKYQLSTLALFVDWLRQNLKVRTGRNTGRGVSMGWVTDPLKGIGEAEGERIHNSPVDPTQGQVRHRLKLEGCHTCSLNVHVNLSKLRLTDRFPFTFSGLGLLGDSFSNSMTAPPSRPSFVTHRSCIRGGKRSREFNTTSCMLFCMPCTCKSASHATFTTGQRMLPPSSRG